MLQFSKRKTPKNIFVIFLLSSMIASFYIYFHYSEILAHRLLRRLIYRVIQAEVLSRTRDVPFIITFNNRSYSLKFYNQIIDKWEEFKSDFLPSCLSFNPLITNFELVLSKGRLVEIRSVEHQNLSLRYLIVEILDEKTKKNLAKIVFYKNGKWKVLK